MPSPSPSFRNRTVLVTGASSGIGREAALAFAVAGANLVLVARGARALAGVATRARKSGVKVLVAPADVTKPAEIAVPPGGALLEKLASLAPGTTDSLLRWATDAAKRVGRASRTGA